MVRQVGADRRSSNTKTWIIFALALALMNVMLWLSEFRNDDQPWSNSSVLIGAAFVCELLVAAAVLVAMPVVLFTARFPVELRRCAAVLLACGFAAALFTSGWTSLHFSHHAGEPVLLTAIIFYIPAASLPPLALGLWRSGRPTAESSEQAADS